MTMNTHDKNEEALYQQIMQELEPGAEEYDRILKGKTPSPLPHSASLGGEHTPNATLQHTPSLRRGKGRGLWGAAAAVFIAVAIGSYFLSTKEEKQEDPLLAEVAYPVKVEEKEQNSEPVNEQMQEKEPAEIVTPVQTEKPKTRPYPKPHEEAKLLMAENEEVATPIEVEEPPTMLTYDDLPVLNPNALDMTEEERALVERRMIEGQRRFLLEQCKALQAEAKIILASFEEE